MKGGAVHLKLDVLRRHRSVQDSQVVDCLTLRCGLLAACRRLPMINA